MQWTEKSENQRPNWGKPANRARHQTEKPQFFKNAQTEKRTKNWPNPQADNLLAPANNHICTLCRPIADSFPGP